MFKNILLKVIVLLFCVASILSCSQIKATDDSNEKVLQMPEPSITALNREAIKILQSMASKYNLSEYEFRLLQDKGLKGDPEAAFRLYLYYERYKKDFNESSFWLMIAAENGNSVGEYNYWFNLIRDTDTRNRLRAIFWLKQAAKHGNKMALSLLKKVSEESGEALDKENQ